MKKNIRNHYNTLSYSLTTFRQYLWIINRKHNPLKWLLMLLCRSLVQLQKSTILAWDNDSVVWKDCVRKQRLATGKFSGITDIENQQYVTEHEISHKKSPNIWSHWWMQTPKYSVISLFPHACLNLCCSACSCWHLEFWYVAKQKQNPTGHKHIYSKTILWN